MIQLKCYAIRLFGFQVALSKYKYNLHITHYKNDFDVYLIQLIWSSGLYGHCPSDQLGLQISGFFLIFARIMKFKSKF